MQFIWFQQSRDIHIHRQKLIQDYEAQTQYVGDFKQSKIE